MQNSKSEKISTERSSKDKLSKVSKHVGTKYNESGIHTRVDSRTTERRDDESEEDNLDPLERATVDDISPRPIRQKPDTLEGLTIKGTSRLVLRDASIGLKGRKVEAFISDDNKLHKELRREYSDDEQQNYNNHKYNTKKDGIR